MAEDAKARDRLQSARHWERVADEHEAHAAAIRRALGAALA
jgi:hypothetical protein